MSRKKISSTIYLSQEQHDALKLLSEKTRVPYSVYVREGIDLVISVHRKKLLSETNAHEADEEP